MFTEVIRSGSYPRLLSGLKLIDMAANTNNSSQESPVRQLRLVVEATDFEAALAFYKDVLGLRLLDIV